MDTNDLRFLAARAILAMADIKAAIAAFDRGEENVWDALATIAQACDTARHRERPHRDAA